MSITETERKGLKEFFEEVAESRSLSLEEVEDAFVKGLALIEANKSGRKKARSYILNRARGAMASILDNNPSRGDAVRWMYFAELGQVKDKNEGERNLIKADLDDGKLEKLLADGKVMYMTVDGKRTAVTEIIDSIKKDIFVDDAGNILPEATDKTVKLTEEIITKGVPWQRGLPVIYRDNRLIVNKYQNFNYTHQLTPQWEIQLIGLAHFKDTKEDLRLFNTTLRYEQADPASDKFFFKRYEPFKWYEDKFELDEKKTRDWKFVFKSHNIAAVPSDEVDMKMEVNDAGVEEEVEIELDEFIGQELERIYAANKDKIVKEKDFIPRMYFLNELDQLHASSVKTDANGNVLRSESGWDKMLWNAMGILVTSVKEAESAKGNKYYVLSDASVKRPINAFTTDTYYNPPKKLPGYCIAAITTDRKPERFDPITRKNIRDVGNGDIGIKVHTMQLLEEFGENIVIGDV